MTIPDNPNQMRASRLVRCLFTVCAPRVRRNHILLGLDGKQDRRSQAEAMIAVLALSLHWPRDANDDVGRIGDVDITRRVHGDAGKIRHP